MTRRVEKGGRRKIREGLGEARARGVRRHGERRERLGRRGREEQRPARENAGCCVKREKKGSENLDGQK